MHKHLYFSECICVQQLGVLISLFCYLNACSKMIALLKCLQDKQNSFLAILLYLSRFSTRKENVRQDYLSGIEQIMGIGNMSGNVTSVLGFVHFFSSFIFYLEICHSMFPILCHVIRFAPHVILLCTSFSSCIMFSLV